MKQAAIQRWLLPRKTLAVLIKDDRSEINGGEWYGDEIWHMFEKHHLRFKEMFEGMQN